MNFKMDRIQVHTWDQEHTHKCELLGWACARSGAL